MAHGPRRIEMPKQNDIVNGIEVKADVSITKDDLVRLSTDMYEQEWGKELDEARAEYKRLEKEFNSASDALSKKLQDGVVLAFKNDLSAFTSSVAKLGYAPGRDYDCAEMISGVSLADIGEMCTQTFEFYGSVNDVVRWSHGIRVTAELADATGEAATVRKLENLCAAARERVQAAQKALNPVEIGRIERHTAARITAQLLKNGGDVAAQFAKVIQVDNAKYLPGSGA